MAQTEVQRREAAHRQAHDVRALQFQCIHHRSDVVGRGRLRIALHILRHVRRPIAARAESHALVAARGGTHLGLPTGVVTAELVHEHDRRAIAGALVVEANAVAGTGVAHRRPLLRNAHKNTPPPRKLPPPPPPPPAAGRPPPTRAGPRRGGDARGALHSTTMKFACDGNTGTAKPGNLAKAPAIIRWFSRCCAITRAIHSPFTAKPAMAARCASTLAPSGACECGRMRASSPGEATSAPRRRPASPSHLEKVTMVTLPCG